MNIELKYRKWYKGIPPKPIKLSIPGWAGEPNEHKNGDEPQPWHCPPFVEGSTYGLELIYPFETECCVTNEKNELKFLGDWSKEKEIAFDVPLPPFMSFAPHHFGMTSSLDIQVPEDYVLRLEPHPRYYTDRTGTVPLAVAGHLQTSWWPKFFFVVFKSPLEGQKYIFRQGEPYAQILIIPKKVSYKIKEMTIEENMQRAKRDAEINELGSFIAENCWKDNKGQPFNDKYKVLSSAHSKNYLEKVIKEAYTKKDNKKSEKKKIFKLFKNETSQKNKKT